jgi:HK97 family phage major capsid protein
VEFSDLQNRAEELINKSSPTAEELSELDSLTEQIVKVGNEFASANEASVKKAALANALAVTKGLSDSVPQANRPVYAQNSETSRTTHKAEVVMSGLKIRRADFTVKEISEETYASLKADGYSDNVIGIATTDQFAKEFIAYAKSGGRRMSGEALTKAMTEAGDGGVLVPIQWAELITNPPMNSMLRTQVRNLPSTVLTQRFPRIKTTNVNFPASPVTVTWGGETPASLPEQGANFKTDMVDITAAEVYASGDFSISLLEDNIYSMNSYIPQVFRETLDVELDKVIIKGTGTGGANPQPWGLNEAGVVPTINAGVTGVISYDDLVNLKAKLPQQYRAEGVWVISSNTWAAIAKLKDKNDRPIWEPNYGYIGNVPGGGATWWDGTLLGRPYIISENMDDMGVGKVPIYYLVPSKAYILTTRVGATIRVLDQPKYTAGCYQFVLRARYGGRVVQPWAAAGLKGI